MGGASERTRLDVEGPTCASGRGRHLGGGPVCLRGADADVPMVTDAGGAAVSLR